MASLKPVIHGRDHLPGGADPIPRLFDLPAFSTTPATGFYSGTISTIAASSSADVSFAYASGSGVLDVSNPTAPAAAVQGVYAVTISIASGDSNWTTDTSMRVGFLPYISYYNPIASKPETNGVVGELALNLTWGMTAGQFFRVEVFNDDVSHSHDFFLLFNCLAQLVYPY